MALTIAGSDPSGGAGIQADLKTFHQFGAYGEAVITLLTVQNTLRVSRVETVPADFVTDQLNAVISDIPPHAAKTGALGSLEIVEAIAAIAERQLFPLVVDPVMVSKHGVPLLSLEACEAAKLRLLPYATLVTPNVPEAEMLTGMDIESPDDVRRAAAILLQTGCAAVLIKGGHLSGEPLDLLLDQDGFCEFPGERFAGKHTHGTGCSYSAAITANLACGKTLRDSIAISKNFIQQAIETAPGLGSGAGPINHFADTQVRRETLGLLRR